VSFGTIPPNLRGISWIVNGKRALVRSVKCQPIYYIRAGGIREAIMNYVIILFGLLITVLSSIILVKPKAALNFFDANSGSLGLYIAAVIVRIGMGVVLIMFADQSRYPEAFLVIGYIVLVAGMILALIGRKRFEQLVRWAMGLFNKIAWIAGLAGIAFGLFFIYAVI
jgi:hypothetical protein